MGNTSSAIIFPIRVMNGVFQDKYWFNAVPPNILNTNTNLQISSVSEIKCPGTFNIKYKDSNTNTYVVTKGASINLEKLKKLIRLQLLVNFQAIQNTTEFDDFLRNIKDPLKINNVVDLYNMFADSLDKITLETFTNAIESTVDNEGNINMVVNGRIEQPQCAISRASLQGMYVTVMTNAVLDAITSSNPDVAYVIRQLDINQLNFLNIDNAVYHIIVIILITAGVVGAVLLWHTYRAKRAYAKHGLIPPE